MIRQRAAVALVLLVVAACTQGSNRATRGAGPSPGLGVPSPTPSPAEPSPPAHSPSPAGGSPSAVGSTAASSTPAAPPAPVACPPPGPRAAPPPGRPRYRLTVDVRPADRVAEGNLSVRFAPDLPTDRLVFRLWPNAPVTAAAGVHLDAGPVTAAGTAAQVSQPDPTTLVVLLGRTLAPGETIEAAMPWRLTLAGPVNDRVSLSDDSVRMGSFVPLLGWEPGAGWATEPATRAHGEAAASPAADFEMAVTAPGGYAVLATGVPDGSGRFVAEAVPDVALSVGHFAIAETTADAGRPEPVRITVGVNAGIAENAATYARKVARVITAHARRFGPYPWPVYTLALTPGLRGGMEYPMHVMQGPGTIGRSTSHEAAHQWFYALVVNNQARDPWLDEALASWAEARHEGTLPSFVRRPIPADARGRTGSPMTYWDGHGASYYRGVYVQGTQALAALGPPEAVDCALASYVALNAYRIARPADLVRSLTAVFPDAAAVLARYGLIG